METGTGKTYVYLRTIFELSKRYGFQKFIIVVPSVAIREGVLKNIEITAEHFRALYNNLPFEHFVYDAKSVNRLRQFATSNTVQILVINIDAFRKNFTGTEDEAEEQRHLQGERSLAKANVPKCDLAAMREKGHGAVAILKSREKKADVLADRALVAFADGERRRAIKGFCDPDGARKFDELAFADAAVDDGPFFRAALRGELLDQQLFEPVHLVSRFRPGLVAGVLASVA